MTDMSMIDAAVSRHQSRAVEIIDRYWHDLSAACPVPRRSAVDAGAIQDALEYAFMADHLSCGHARLRVAGGALSAIMGMEVAGMPLSVLAIPPARKAFNLHIARVFDEPVQLCMNLHAAAQYGKPSIEAQLRLYPLRDDVNDITKCIGTFITSGPTGRTPRRFDIGEVATAAITTPMLPPPPALARRGHLRLVVSN
ncbi:PAS domain-containing protein [Marivita sp. S2033]|uniref:PAS domain-containing protein n=1 Tax=Marivita sp. S2033 TaxID=3373187 RepID=UPI003981A775